MHPTESTFPVEPLNNTKAFEPIKVGENTLSSKIVHAPTTRRRANDDHSPSDLQLQYYDDRTKEPGSLAVTEAIFVSERTGLYEYMPGIWSQDQVKSWKKITDQVHKNKSFISAQFWALGRVADAEYMKKKGLDILAPSAIPFSGNKQDIDKFGTGFRAATTQEMKDIIYQDFSNAAKNAMEAGFDYIELHTLHGYFLDQVLQSNSNHRTDEYGGSIEKRANYVLELIDHLSSVIGAHRVAIRLSPWATFQDMLGADNDPLPVDQFGYLIAQLQKRADQGQEIAYISVVEPRVSGNMDVLVDEQKGSNQFVYDLWKGVIMRAGSYSYDAPKFNTLREQVEDNRTLVAFGRFFTSNPDLITRLKNGNPLVPYHRDTFYNPQENFGYNTYSRYGESQDIDEAKERSRKSKSLIE